MRMTVVFAATHGSAMRSLSMALVSLAQGRRHISSLLAAGNHDIAAEIVNKDGDVVHTYEQSRGWRQEQR